MFSLVLHCSRLWHIHTARERERERDRDRDQERDWSVMFTLHGHWDWDWERDLEILCMQLKSITKYYREIFQILKNGLETH